MKHLSCTLFVLHILASLPSMFRLRSSSSLEFRLQPSELAFAEDGLGMCLFGTCPGIISLLLLPWWVAWEQSVYAKAVACIRKKRSASCSSEICQIGPYHRATGFAWQLLILCLNIFVTVESALKFKGHQGKTVLL